MALTSWATDLVRQNALRSVVFFPLLAALMMIRHYRSPWRQLPPGPRGLPLLGNLHQMAQDKQWITFAKWAEIYGPILYLNAAGQPIIVLGSLTVAADLLDRRASIYSDRPQNIAASDMMAGGMFMAFTRFNDLWKRMRKASHEEFKKSVAPKYHPAQSREAIRLTESLLAKGNDWRHHFELASASSIMSAVYGMHIHSSRDVALVKVNAWLSRLTTAALPGTYLVEFFTWMQYIPASLAGWKRRVLAAFKEGSGLFQDLFDSALQRKANGDDRPTIAARLTEDTARNQLSYLECSWLAATMYAAGTETTTGVLAWWLLAMLAYPETQKRAQEEIDRVVGRDRLPTFADMKNMPYVQAMVKESLRWGPIGPVGVPHRLMEDDWYNGYFLPKDSIVLVNVWAINRDAALFGDDTHHFNPSRHLDDEGQVAPSAADTKEEGHVTYGFGRRICVGRHFANNSLFIDIATMLWAMNIERVKDEMGNLAKLDLDGVEDRGLAVRPLPFDCKFTPRSIDVLTILDGAKEI